MFESLTDKLQGAFRKFGSRGVVTEEDLDVALREVRMALLEADVNFKVVREFTSRVKERALGAEVLRSLTPAQHVIDIVHGELVQLLGGEAPKLASAAQPPTVVMVVGLQGSGKTTSVAKLANLLKKQGNRPLIAACDIYRPAAIQQLVTVASGVGVPVHEEGTSVNPRTIAINALDKAKRTGATHLLIDTAGRLHVDEEMMREVADIRSQLNPVEVLFVADAMAGQDAVTAAKEFHDKVGTTGLILTKMDGDARGGAALSIRSVTGVPVKFIGVGEKADALEAFYPDRLAGRILGMGDMLTLIERAKDTMGEEDSDKFNEKLKRGTFDLQDFLEQMRKVQKMGPLGQLVSMLPGFNKIKAQLNVDEMDDSFFGRAEAIVLSMTKWERRHPEKIDGKRRRRIATGSGTTPHDVNQLLKQFFEARKISKQLSSGRFPAMRF
ncbi:MAG: signal recognition particle protein [Dehalococcoidia bacterium]|nr:signal recognition particle protein [Dehalococcoidia bacterium]MCB9484690.1 signal recognition particle protein [Thermoflexaceae bacterium]